MNRTFHTTRTAAMRWLLCAALLLLTACAQAQDVPAPIKALSSKGVQIKGPMQAPAGFKGYVGDYHGQAMPVYLLPDGKHVLIGTLLDDMGNDLTQGPLHDAATPPIAASTWADLDKATWIAEGSAHPKRIVYVFTDTECPYCHKLWTAIQPMLAGGNVQVRYIIVAVIAPKSLNRAATILDAPDPKAMFQQHEKTFGHSAVQPEATVPPATARKIEANTALMSKLGIQGTPATVHKDAAGKIQIEPGMMPQDELRSIFVD